MPSRRLYSLLLYAALPWAAARFAWRGWLTPAQRGSLAARLGIGLAPRSDAPLWLHAASVGELRASMALVDRLGQAVPLLITVGTPAGLARAREKYAGVRHVSTQPAPWDLPGATRRFIAAVRPRGAVFIETELWPNLIATAHAAGIPLALVSARLSARSLRRYQRWGADLMRATVRAFAAIGAQTDDDRARFVAIGAAPAVVSVTGNLKFDVPVEDGWPETAAALRRHWAPSRALWVAGSTHQGEEAVLLDAHRQLAARLQQAGAATPLLAIAPRRPERFNAVARWLATRGIPHARSSNAAAAAGRDVDVLLIDEMGRLPAWYGAADAAFVGGSLVPVGGHNLLEPAALARPVLTGPHVHNAPEVARSLVDAGGAVVADDASALAAQLATWLIDPAAARECGARAAAAVAAHRGAADRTVALLRAVWSSPARSSVSAP